MVATGRLESVLRRILGLIFVIGPVAAAFHLAPEPSLPPNGAAFVGALAGSGYMLPLLWATEIVGGVLLLLGAAVPFALVLLAPIVVNIIAFHLVLAPNGLPIALAVGILEIVLAWAHRHTFATLFRSMGHESNDASEPAHAVTSSAVRS